MSNLLNLNGIAVPCSVNAGGKVSTEEVGTSKRAVDGTMLIHRRVTKKRWSFTTTLQDDFHARAFRSLVLGLGHYWSFDANLYSSKGLIPTSTVAAVYSAGSAYLGAGKLVLTATTGVFTVTVKEIIPSTEWTVIAAYKSDGAWGYWVFTSSSPSLEWVDGAPGSGLPSDIGLTVTPATGVVQFAEISGGDTWIDELVVLPYAVPTDWPPQMYALAAASKQWSSLARINANGTGIDGNTRTVAVKGTAGDLSLVPATLAGASFAENNANFAFQLEEV